MGDGIYKSTDGGETWTHSGLEKSERISKIEVDPTNSDVVYAAVPGALWSDSPDRGLYKTPDGGKTWNLILKGSNLSTGCSTVAMDPSNPNRMFAGLWDFRRKGWTFRSGGDGPDKPSGSGLYRSNDGGQTWSEVTPENSKGFPKKLSYGRSRSRIRTVQPQAAFMRSSNRLIALSSFLMMAGKAGIAATKVTGWCGVRFILPI